MATIGMDKLYYAKITEDENGNETYDTPKVLAKAMKADLSVELAEARKILNARNEYVAAAKREADEIRKRAEIEANQMVSEAPVMGKARQMANELVAQAEQDAKKVRRSANEYCLDILRRTEEALADAHSEMSQTYTRFHSAMAPAGNTTAAPTANSRLYDAEADI